MHSAISTKGSPREVSALGWAAENGHVPVARTLLSSGPLVAQVMWRACGLKGRCYQGVARPTTGLLVLPGLVCLSARGHRPGHAAVRELSSSRVFGASLTL